MLGILGEDDSDTGPLVVLAKRISGNESLSIRRKGFGGKGNLLKKGAALLKIYVSLGVSRFIVALDADMEDPNEVKSRVDRSVVHPAGVSQETCIVIPVQEIEAWFLADVGALRNTIPTLTIVDQLNPESVSKPRVFIERQSRGINARPKYSHITHNVRIAESLNLQRVFERCPSFRPLYFFLKHSSP